MAINSDLLVFIFDFWVVFSILSNFICYMCAVFNWICGRIFCHLILRRRETKNKWQWMMSIVSMLMWMILISLNRNDGILDYLAVRSGTAEFQMCKDDGIPISNGGRFSICKTEEFWWRSGFVRSIVYDSSGQISYLNKQQTLDWSAATLKLGNGLAKGVAPERGGLFGISPYDVRHLYGSYYIVDFYDPS